MLGAAEDEPRPAGSRGAARLDAPAAAHPQVAAQDVSAGEAEEEVLPDRLHRFEHGAVQPLGDPLRRRARMRRLDADRLADEHLQPAGGEMERIALGHG